MKIFDNVMTYFIPPEFLMKIQREECERIRAVVEEIYASTLAQRTNEDSPHYNARCEGFGFACREILARIGKEAE